MLDGEELALPLAERILSHMAAMMGGRVRCSTPSVILLHPDSIRFAPVEGAVGATASTKAFQIVGWGGRARSRRMNM